MHPNKQIEKQQKQILSLEERIDAIEKIIAPMEEEVVSTEPSEPSDFTD